VAVQVFVVVSAIGSVLELCTAFLDGARPRR